MSFNGSSAVAIQKAQSIMKKPGIKKPINLCSAVILK
jgi:hypothetical protein